MEQCASDAFGPAWFLAAVHASVSDSDQAETDDVTPPNVIIAVSLDELDGLTGEMLV